jgi:hypothetical protein
MKIYLTLFIYALILLCKIPQIKSKNLETEKKLAIEKNLLHNHNHNQNNLNRKVKKPQQTKLPIIKTNNTNIKLLNSTRNFYKEAAQAAENFLKQITNLVISDFEILKENKFEGISLEVLKNMIHNDKEFLINVPDKDIEMKFKEYDIFKKGFLDKITYSGILSEFVIAEAAIKKLNKFFEEGMNLNSTNLDNGKMNGTNIDSMRLNLNDNDINDNNKNKNLRDSAFLKISKDGKNANTNKEINMNESLKKMK